MIPDLKPVTELARERGLGRTTLLTAISKGLLPAKKLGKQWFARPSDVDAYQKAAKERVGGRPRTTAGPNRRERYFAINWDDATRFGGEFASRRAAILAGTLLLDEKRLRGEAVPERFHVARIGMKPRTTPMTLSDVERSETLEAEIVRLASWLHETEFIETVRYEGAAR